MARFMSIMELRMFNSDDYQIAEEWCEQFAENGEFEVPEPETNPDTFEISYEELDIDEDEAREIFREFACYMSENGITDKVEVHFCISPDNSGEETQFLFTFNDGETTERYAAVDLSDLDEDELETWRFDPEYLCHFDL